MDPATTAVINYLEQRAEIDRVYVKDKGTCSSDAFLRWEEKNECELPDDLKKFYTMSDGLEIRWSIKTGNNTLIPTVIGKMHINSLNDLTRITSSGSKQTAVDELNDFAENDSPRFNSRSWYIFELDSCDEQERVCLVYGPNRDISIWFMDRSLQFYRLASTFTDYYRLFLLHCGLPYWQYKYTDFGIPPYILHWYYAIIPALLISHSNDDISSLNLIQFNAEKVFQRNTNNSSKNPKPLNQQNSTGQTQQAYSMGSIRSATQNQKRSIQQTKSINRSSSVPRSMNNQ
ncbi:unnamed protein product [Rotaria sordida]|uniref:Knr4/Smi1-like domain-containing protein n=1 Tax=Rotaria sordida TaxID=392033 RepID=A0A813SWN2_9BILA|nr:unnamed protein product [Rotaria sordida]CAF0812048.1 unnamed protein product [Rotaria sordida]